MEKIRERLKFGNKVGDVKLRRRKSQLYSKEDECPLNNGGMLLVKLSLLCTVQYKDLISMSERVT